jgi:23S rRNA pseudouridine1911/1915/1917 synthase
VHLEYIGHPVICDQKYGKGYNTKLKLLSDENRKQLKIDRHALHSSKLSFRHPISDELMIFESKLPDDLNMLKNVLSEI